MTESAITEDDLIEGYAVDVPGTAIVPAGPTAPTVTPQVGAAELVARLATIREAMETAMTPDVDYGVIPGTNKPTLLKPGAEKLSALFQLDVQIVNEKLWDAPHLTVISHATVYHAPSGTRLGYGEGVCTTRERKYAVRQQQRLCPSCGLPAVIKGKQEYGGGWLCFKKKGGCGSKWNDGAPEIESQAVGEIENPDLPDMWNTVVKMAEKRARVDAVLAVTGASALFTQDAEDLPRQQAAEPPPPTSARLTDAQRNRVLSGIADANQNEALIFAAVGVSSAEELTAEHSRQIRVLLDRALDGAVS